MAPYIANAICARRLCRVTHIWFSHQHPDHFTPADLRAIAPSDRASITIFYHETIDKKVVRFYRGMGFRAAMELKPDRWYPFSARVPVLCNACARCDVLNINDCIVDRPERAKRIARYVPRVDVLLTQFSYANWIGNPDDVELRRIAAQEKVDRLQHSPFRLRVSFGFVTKATRISTIK